MHEASLYEQNCFVTLTYNEEHLPDLKSLDYRAFQLFMKRLRKQNTGKKIKFYMCGEYGDEGDRPHYHAALFNHNFDDREYYKTTPAGNRLYISETLNKLWSDENKEPLGYATIGDITFESAAYIARYIMKKQNGKDKNWNYAVPDVETGEILYKEKEFAHMSLKEGIGLKFYKKWKSDIFPEDTCVINGTKTLPPKYYLLKYKEEHPEEYDNLLQARQLRGISKQADNTEERLLVKETVAKAKVKFYLKRDL